MDVLAIRQKLGFTQEELAEKIGVSRNTIGNYERGGVVPRSKITMLEKLYTSTMTNIGDGANKVLYDNSELLSKLKRYADATNTSLDEIFRKSGINRNEISHQNTNVWQKLLNSFPDLNGNWLLADRGHMIRGDSVDGSNNLKYIESLQGNISTYKALISVYEEKIQFLENQVESLTSKLETAK